MTRMIMVAALAALFACENAADETTTPQPDPTPSPTTLQEDKMNESEAVQYAMDYRARIENNLDRYTQTTLPLTNAREQVAQKWTKMDVYRDGDDIVRIKTYPHEGISTRTEEFYFENGGLVLAFIEDEGTGATGKKEGRMGKTYIFSNSTFVTERNNTGEAEITDPETDAQRLLQEAKEYLELAQ